MLCIYLFGAFLLMLCGYSLLICSKLILLVNSIIGFLVQCMNFKLSSQLKALFHAAVLATFPTIWFAQNSIRFDGLHFCLEKASIFISLAIREVNSLLSGAIFNSVSELGILRNLGVAGFPGRTKITLVVWYAPLPGYIKVNTNGAALDAPGVVGCRGVFRMSRGFVKSCFWGRLPISMAFEIELWVVIKVVWYACSFWWSCL